MVIGAASILQQILLIFLCSKSPGERRRRRKTGRRHALAPFNRANWSGHLRFLTCTHATNHGLNPAGSYAWAEFNAGCTLTGTTGKAKWGEAVKTWGRALNLANVPTHTRSYATWAQWQGCRHPASRQGVWVSLADDWKKGTEKPNKFYIHSLILDSDLCFLSKTSFKVQNLFQWDIPNQIFKEEIFICLMALHGNKKTL